MMPMTNSQIAARQRETEAKYGTAAAPAVVQQSYTCGEYQVTWVGDSRVPAEVRRAGQVVHTGTRDECIAWAKGR